MEFIGNKKAVNFLQKSLEKGKISHAYIFSGPEHVGKFSLAKKFALGVIAGKDLEMSENNVDKDAMLDLIVVSPEIIEKKGISKQKDIPIESVRDAQQSLSLFPYHGKKKVLIIDDAHRLTNSAQNALLKILEEPNETTMMILVTHEIDRILPTAQSRCQAIHFSLASEAEMEKEFSKEITLLSMGRSGLAQGMKESSPGQKDILGELSVATMGSLNEKFKLAEELSKDIPATIAKMNMWMWVLRKNALSMEENERSGLFVSIEKIQESIAVLKRTNANGRLLLEALFMDL